MARRIPGGSVAHRAGTISDVQEKAVLLSSVRARKLLHGLAGGGLELALRGLLEPRLEAAEPLLRLDVLRLRAADVRADELEVLLEAREVLAELGAVRHHLAGVLLDLEPLEAEEDDQEVCVERGRGDRDDLALERVAERAGLSTEAVADELVVDGLGGEVHEGELVGALVRADVLVRDRVDVPLDVADELLRVELALRVALGLDHA